MIGTAARDGTELATFFVHPTRQGQGVGTLLLAHLEARARSAGVKRLRIDASVTGVSFYEHRGYQRTGAVVVGTAGPQITLSKEFGAHAG